MKKWNVSMTVDATINVEVEAESEEEAKRKALETASRPGLCHQCSRELDIGDVLEAIEAYEIGG